MERSEIGGVLKLGEGKRMTSWGLPPEFFFYVTPFLEAWKSHTLICILYKLKFPVEL